MNADVCCVCGTREALDAAASDPNGPHCIRENGCRHLLTQECAHGCAAAADDVTRLGEEMEPETPECSHESWEVTGERHTPEGWLKWRKCADCRDPLPDLIEAEPHWLIEPAKPEPEPEAPRRPPNAVAYVLEDGTPFEIALPGDATVRSEDGVLIVMHTQSPVKGLVQVKPWGDQ